MPKLYKLVIYVKCLCIKTRFQHDVSYTTKLKINCNSQPVNEDGGQKKLNV